MAAAAWPGSHHRGERRRPERDRDVLPGRQPVRLQPALDRAVHLSAHGRGAGALRQDRPAHRRWPGDLVAPSIPHVDGRGLRPRAFCRQHHQHRRRPRGCRRCRITAHERSCPAAVARRPGGAVAARPPDVPDLRHHLQDLQMADGRALRVCRVRGHRPSRPAPGAARECRGAPRRSAVASGLRSCEQRGPTS